MSQKKSTGKSVAPISTHKDVKYTLVRFRDSDSLNRIRDAAALEDYSLNKFIARAALAAANKKLQTNTSSSK